MHHSIKHFPATFENIGPCGANLSDIWRQRKKCPVISYWLELTIRGSAANKLYITMETH
jgi:hypothetical protein